jgi:hypothetical protein
MPSPLRVSALAGVTLTRTGPVGVGPVGAAGEDPYLNQPHK